MKPLPHSFFDRPAPQVARNLIGAILVRKRKIGERMKTERFTITETEAYYGFDDRASHARHGKTMRNEIMWRSAGHIYVYFTYGIHWMLNIVTGARHHPGAVLIRGIEHTGPAINGPAKLTRYLGINGKLNGRKLGRASGLWIEKAQRKYRVKTTPRIGIDYAGTPWAEKKWRFVLRTRTTPPQSLRQK